MFTNSTTNKKAAVLVGSVLSIGVDGYQALQSSPTNSGYARFKEFKDNLTTTITGRNTGLGGFEARAVHSSGGAAGGVVSEGQGYGCAIAAGTYVGLGCGDDASKDGCSEVLGNFYELFLGWQQTCKLNGRGQQQQSYCTAANDGQAYACLPAWKCEDDLNFTLGDGSATDGDVDAAKAFILMILAVAQHNPRPIWYTEVADWAYGTCKQIYVDDSKYESGKTSGQRILTLGSDWGGFGGEGQNPSYHCPATIRMCGEFMTSYTPSTGDAQVTERNGSTVTLTEKHWKEMYTTTYNMLKSNVEDGTSGFVTNWWKYNADGSGETGFSGSGTESTQFGAEASRSVWRIAIDAIWFASADGTNEEYKLSDIDRGFSSKKYLSKLSKHFKDNKFDLIVGDALPETVHADPEFNAFMFGPTMTSLVSNANAAAELDYWSDQLDTHTIDEYYSGSWVALATLTVNGDFAKASNWMGTDANGALRMKDRFKACATTNCAYCTGEGVSEVCTDCKLGYWLDNGVCREITCDTGLANAKSCSSSDPSNPSKGDTIDECIDNYSLTSNNQCHKDCATGHFNTDLLTCVPCDYDATLCNAVSCEAEVDGQGNFTGKSTNTSCLSGQCVDTAATGDNCETCLAGYIRDEGKCSFDCDRYNQCLVEIASRNGDGSGNTNPTDTWECCVTKNEDDGTCEEPIAGMTLDNKWWVTGTPTAPPSGTCGDTPVVDPSSDSDSDEDDTTITCDSGYSVNSGKTGCDKNPTEPNCELADASGACLSGHCINGWVYDSDADKNCACPNGKVGLATNQQCKDDTPTVCSDGLELYHNSCVPKCGANETRNDNTGDCEDNSSDDTGECPDWVQNCDSCDSKGACIECAPGYWLQSGQHHCFSCTETASWGATNPDTKADYKRQCPQEL